MNINEKSSSRQTLVQMRNISKKFGRVSVLNDVHMDIFPGEVHALAGENGAGKSTLVKILAGVHTEFQGSIEIDGKSVRPASPLDANALGIVTIYQELSLVPSMSVADNIFLGRSICQHGFVKRQVQQEEARHVLHELGVDIDVEQLVETFPIATQQLIEISKAMSIQAKVIIMDEPTSALRSPEVRKLFHLIETLKERGCGIVYITHKMEEIEEIADRITVLRDGEYIGTAPVAELPVPKLIKWMVGREMDQLFPRHGARIGEDRLQVKNFSIPSIKHRQQLVVNGVSLTVRAGEILGVGGLQGSGASELFMGLFGAYGKMPRGQVALDGNIVHIHSPRQAIEHGIGLLTNDRKATGLVLSMSVVANTTLADLRRLSPGGWRKASVERQATEELGKALGLRATSLDMDVDELSGGNQQKVVLAKWLQITPQILLLDEPTRGVDIGAKHEIYQLMNEWTEQGIAILLITSEMLELLAMSDRIVVMHRGKITAEYTHEQASAELVLEAAMGKTINGNNLTYDRKKENSI